MFWLVVSFLAAAPVTYGVVGLESPAELTALSARIADLAAREVESQGHTAILPAEMLRRIGDGSFQSLRTCAASACLGDAPKAGVKRLIFGSLTKDKQAYLLQLHVADAEERRLLTSIRRRILLETRRLLPDVQAALPR